MTKNVTERVREHRQRMRDKGYVKKDVWILPEHAQLLKIVEGYLKYERFNVDMMTQEILSNN